MLLDREDVIAAVDRVLDGARMGRGAALLVEGPVGIGKTALIEEVGHRASGFVVARLAGGEFERDLPMGVVRGMFESIVWRATDADRARWFRGSSSIAGWALGVPGTEATGDEPGVDSVAMRWAFYWLAVAVAEDRPLCVLVDDVQWADRESLRWLLFCARQLQDTGIALIMAGRDHGAGVDEPLIDALAGLPDVQSHRLGELSQSATGQLVQAWSQGTQVGSGFVRACHQRSQGNPLMLMELLREASRLELQPDGEGAARLETLVPEGVTRSVQLRLRALGARAVSLAKAIAILGSSARLADAAELAEVSLAEAAADADLLIRADVLRDGQQLELAHPLLRGAIMGGLTSPARGLLHARAARVLASRGASADVVGAHLLLTPPAHDYWVVDQLMRAAEQARAQGSPEAAARLLQRALEEPPEDATRAALHAALGSARCTSGDANGIENIRIARELTDDPVQRAMLALQLGTPYFFLGRGVEVDQMLIEALAQLGDREPELAFGLRTFRASAPWCGARFDPSELIAELLEQARAIAAPTPVMRPALGGLAAAAVQTGFPASLVRAIARQAIGELEDHRHAIALGFPLFPALIALVLAEDLDGIEQRLQLAEDGVRHRGAVTLGVGNALCARSVLALITGAPGDAADLARGAVELLTGSAFTVLQAQSVVLLASALRERGELESAERALACGPAQEASGVWFAVGQAERGALALARGDHRQARTEALAAGALFGQIGARNWFPSSWRTTAAFALRIGGEVAEAGRLAAEQVSDARRFGAAGAVGSALRVEGAVLDDLDRVLEAERLLASSPLRLEHARALVDIGAAMRRRGERARAREPLYTGMEIAGRCGAEPLAERALTELRATGARPRKVVRSGTEALTASERRVAVLAASGRTNREIAGELFITMATVETHLRSTFRKLDVRSRNELGERLQAGEGATAPG